MADSLVTLTSPQGSTVRVAQEQVAQLLAAGFTKPKSTSSKSGSSSSKSSK